MQFERTGVPGYEVGEVLGQGGFATVYRARQLAVGREVALKMDSRVLATDRDRQRFLREVTAAGQLSGHPHVVAVYDAGVLDNGRPYMVLELCPGGSLGDRLHQRGPLPAAEARDIGVRIADALAAAHASGVLHRDIKPGNIMIDRYGNVGLADFGLAAMPRPGQELSVTREALTPAYAPPEAFRLAEPTPAGDVYSLAATIYALVHGRPPHFPAEGSLGIAEVIVRHTWPLPDLPGVSPRLTEVLRHAMAPDPADRLPSAAALRDALAALDLSDPGRATPAPVAAPPSPLPTTVSPSTASPRRRKVRVRVSVAALAVVVVGTGATVAYEYLPPSTSQAPTAGRFPSDGMTNNQRQLENHPGGKTLCSPKVLAASRQGDARDIAPDRWTIDVLPPTQTQYADGLRVMRCVATITGEESTGAHFRPRT